MRPIILDCDPGHDDAVAIMLALGNPAIDVRAITTVGGNHVVDKITANALGVLAACHDSSTPVYKGAAKPLMRPVEVAETIHGETGLGGVDLPSPLREIETDNAVSAIIRLVMESDPGELTLVATGPLTNIALAARVEPRIVERVREVVVMGGAISGGNWSACAEFNIHVDPEAAAIVFDEPWPVTMVGLDLTHQALATAQVEEKIRALDTPLGSFTLDLLAFFRETYRDVEGFDDPPVHDPCTIAYLIDPTIVETIPAPVSVEWRGELTRGMTVVDRRAQAAQAHTRVATRLDHERFFDLVVEAISTLSHRKDNAHV